MLTEREKQIFEIASALEGNERSRYLEEQCSDDPAMRGHLDLYLAGYDAANEDRFLQGGAVTLAVPTVFREEQLVADRFRIQRLIGYGGMGEVYEAFDERLGMRIALKTLRSGSSGDLHSIDRFRREIRVTRSLSHENLCRVFDLVEHRERNEQSPDCDRIVTCLTMELIDGENLQHYLKQSGPLNPKAALALVRQVVGAVAVLHENGIIHRDLKPSNIMITKGRGGEQRAVVTDFGLAKNLTSDGSLFESKADFQAGAPYFVAPEALRNEPPTFASDIYSLGLIVDEMVTKSRAFPSESVEALFYEKLHGAPIPPGKRATGLPEGWSRVILRCLATRPEQRYSRVTDVLADLEDVLLEVKPRPILLRGWRFPVISRLRVGRRALLLSAGVLLATAAATLSLAVSHPRSTSLLVFPIENWTGKSEYDYLCKGTNAEVRRRLSRIESIQVIPYYEPRSKAAGFSPRTQFALDAHLQHSGDQVRLTVELTDNSSGRQVWSENFDRSTEDPLQLQTEIASRAVNAMYRQLALEKVGADHPRSAGFLAMLWPLRRWLSFQAQRPAEAPTNSTPAMQAYMRGFSLWEERTLPESLAAEGQFQQALRLDPDFALASAALAGVQLTLIEHNFASRTELLERARRYAEDSILRSPGVAEGHTALAAVYQYKWDWARADSSYREAIRLKPNLALAQRWYAGMLLQFGRFEEALARGRLAMDLDPYNYPARSAFGFYLLYSGHYQEAAALLEDLLARKDLLYAHEVLGTVYAKLGSMSQEDDGRRYLDRALEQADLVTERERGSISVLQGPKVGLGTSMYALIYGLRGERESAQRYLNDLLAGWRAGAVPAEDVARAYLALGENGLALDVLEKSVAAKESGVLYIKVHPFLEALRPDPRFRHLIERMQL